MLLLAKGVLIYIVYDAYESIRLKIMYCLIFFKVYALDTNLLRLALI